MTEQTEHDRDDDALARLVQLAGLRAAPPPDSMARVSAEVRVVWQQKVRARQWRRRSLALAASTVFAAAGVFWLSSPRQQPPALATVDQVHGSVQVEQDGSQDRLSNQQTLGAGSEIRTGDNGRASLRLAQSATFVRLDVRTTATLSKNEVHLKRGALYLDNHGASDVSWQVVTPHARIDHVGTQYQARIADDTTRIGVREGLVNVSTGHGPVRGQAGAASATWIEVPGQGAPAQYDGLPYGDDWRWADTVAPALEMDDRTVDEVLAWVARQTGHELRYASSEVQTAAGSSEMKGSLSGFTPQKALQAVLVTTRFRAQIGDDGVIDVNFAPR